MKVFFQARRIETYQGKARAQWYRRPVASYDIGDRMMTHEVAAEAWEWFAETHKFLDRKMKEGAFSILLSLDDTVIMGPFIASDDYRSRLYGLEV